MKKKETIFNYRFTPDFFSETNFHICIHKKYHSRLLSALNVSMPSQDGDFAAANLYFNDFNDKPFTINFRKHSQSLYMYFTGKAKNFLQTNAANGDFYYLYSTDKPGSLLFVIDKAKPFVVVDLFSGSYARDYSCHEIYNIDPNPNDGKYYGYCPPYDDLDIKNLGAGKDDELISGITVVYVKRTSPNSTDREVIAFCDNATIYSSPQSDISLGRLGLNQKGATIHYSYTVESDNMVNLSNERNKFIIRTNLYNAYLFRYQRYFQGGYPSLDDDLLKYLDYCRKRQEFLDDELYQSQIQNAFGNDSSEDKPEIGNASSSVKVKRNPVYAKNAIERANFKCEFDKNHSTFMTPKGSPYMEGHHLIPCTPDNAQRFFEKYGVNIDCEENIVSLCPTCHRRIHFGSESEKRIIIDKLYKLTKTSLAVKGIKITLQELYDLYK